MTIHTEVRGHVLQALETLKADGMLGPDADVANVNVEAPKDPTHGDLATNAAMVLAKAAKRKPRDIAEALVPLLRDVAMVAAADVAGPGFINLTLDPAAWQGVVRDVLSAGDAYGCQSSGEGVAVNVEYVSANPTGPMHVGHGRGAVFGDALANLLAFNGYDVTREYYINDAGGQIAVLARSAHLRYREALGEEIGEIPQGLYPGDYLKPVGAALVEAHGEALRDIPEEDWRGPVASCAIEMMMAQIKRDLAALNIHHDVFFSEASLNANGRDRVREAMDALDAKGLLYEGRLPPPKGEPPDDWEDREQTLFRSTDFGDDVDRALLKSDGSYTYFAGDVAYHFDKLERGFTTLINVFGADHAGYIKRLTSVVKALSDERATLDIKVCQLVNLLRDGVPVKMGKRSGTFVTLADVVDEVGADPVRFMMLFRRNAAALDFDFAKVTERSKDNPVFYVQYAHARTFSSFRNAQEAFAHLDATSAAVLEADLSLLNDAGEIDLMRRMADFPKLIAEAAVAREPHRIAFYLYDLAAAFHAQWARGNDSPHLRIIQPDEEELTAARLALVLSLRHVLSTGLRLLGVHAPEELR
ncbi:MAG: arginine--tRNA ligase [Pseudomonadota bacterium]